MIFYFAAASPSINKSLGSLGQVCREAGLLGGCCPARWGWCVPFGLLWLVHGDQLISYFSWPQTGCHKACKLWHQWELPEQLLQWLMVWAIISEELLLLLLYQSSPYKFFSSYRDCNSKNGAHMTMLGALENERDCAIFFRWSSCWWWCIASVDTWRQSVWFIWIMKMKQMAFLLAIWDTTIVSQQYKHVLATLSQHESDICEINI